MAIARTNNHCGMCVHWNGGIGNWTCGDCFGGSKLELPLPPKQEGKAPQVIGTEARVCQDIERRQKLGIAKYGTTVECNPLSLKEWLQHQYEELLDAAVYCKRAIEEMEKK